MVILSFLFVVILSFLFVVCNFFTIWFSVESGKVILSENSKFWGGKHLLGRLQVLLGRHQLWRVGGMYGCG